MPNHVTNILEIVGDEDTIKKCLDTIKGEDRIIDFRKILPMPELLSHIGSGRTIIDGQAYEEWYFDTDPDNPYLTIDRKLTGPEYRELQKHPERNWYDWSIAHWGTKWNAYDQEFISQSEEYVSFRFDTAWSSPMPVIETLAKMFPTLTFGLTYADEDLGYNTGKVRFNLGYVVQESYPEGGSNEAFEIVLVCKDYASEYIKKDEDGNYGYVDDDDYDEQEVA